MESRVSDGEGTAALPDPFPCPLLFWSIDLKNSLASYGGMCYKSHSLCKKLVQTSRSVGVLGKHEWP